MEIFRDNIRVVIVSVYYDCWQRQRESKAAALIRAIQRKPVDNRRS
jgi:hypothetical protein